jgi:hypothetical protein
MAVPSVAPGMIVASEHKQDQPGVRTPEGHNQRRAVLDIIEFPVYGDYDRATRERPQVGTRRKAMLTGGGREGGQTTFVTLEGDDLPRYRLVSAPDPHVAELVACFEGIKSSEGRDHWRVENDVTKLVQRALLAERHADGSPRAKEDVTLDQEAIRLIAERIFTLTQIVEQSGMVTLDQVGAGYAPAQPALAAVDELSNKVDEILAKMPAKWGDGE